MPEMMEQRKKLHPIVMLDYIPRITGHLLACSIFLLTLYGQNRSISIPLIFALANAIVWPNITLYLSIKSQNPKKLEFIWLFIDAYILGLWISFIAFSSWPTYCAISAILLSDLSLRGIRLALQGILAIALGIMTGILFFGFQLYWHTDTLTTLLCMVLISVFYGVLCYMTYYRAKVTKQIKEKLKLSNHELGQSLCQLQQSKAQLVQSEKMAGIGQLIAGISHEINTPAGAISSAIEEIDTDYVCLLESLILIVGQLNPELVKVYFEVCNEILQIPNEYDTIETRRIAQEIKQILDDSGIEDTRTLSKNLATIGFKDKDIPKLLPLLKSELRDLICDSLFMLGMTRIHTRDIKIAIQKIRNLVKALKLFSRSDQEEVGYTNLEEDIKTTLIILNNRLKHGITIIKEFDSIPEVQCVAERLNQIWLNMINNAIEAMKGTGQIIIRIKLFDAEHIKVEFEDNGPGIPPDVLPRVFEAYYTTKPKGEGTGLGLYISEEIIQSHHGKIEIDTSDKGTIFRIILPIKWSTKNEQS